MTEQMSGVPVRRAPNLIMVSTAVAIVVIGCAFAYRIVILEPQQEAARAVQAQAEAQVEAQRKREETAQKEAAEKRQRYEQCIASSQAVYWSNWNSDCAVLSATREQQFQNCLSQRRAGSIGDASESEQFSANQCRRYLPALPSTNCQLPMQQVSLHDERLKEAKQLCLSQAQAGL
jgi:hypothetical protein